jgi:transposase
MSKAYSRDLRDQVIKSYEAGMPKKDLVEIFKIGISTLNRWIRQYLETGSIDPKKRSRYRKRKIEDEVLKKYVEEYRSSTLEEIARHFQVSPVSVWHRLKKLGITRKKRPFCMKKEIRANEKNSQV